MKTATDNRKKASTKTRNYNHGAPIAEKLLFVLHNASSETRRATIDYITAVHKSISATVGDRSRPKTSPDDPRSSAKRPTARESKSIEHLLFVLRNGTARERKAVVWFLSQSFGFVDAAKSAQIKSKRSARKHAN